MNKVIIKRIKGLKLLRQECGLSISLLEFDSCRLHSFEDLTEFSSYMNEFQEKLCYLVHKPVSFYRLIMSLNICVIYSKQSFVISSTFGICISKISVYLQYLHFKRIVLLVILFGLHLMKILFTTLTN